LRPSYWHGTNKSLQTHKGRRSAERRILRDRSAPSERCRWAGSRRAPLLADALAFRRSTAVLAEILLSTQSGPALQPPANEVTSPIPGTAPARINRPSPVDVP
jgi:hypothetical protein